MQSLDEFNEAGVTMLPPLSASQTAAAVSHLKSRPVRPGCHVWHAAGAPRPWDDALSETVLCWHHYDVMSAPHLLKHALAQTNLAAQIVGRDPPILYSINAFCTRPANHLRPDIQDWHRDSDDTKFVPMFVFLTDGNVQEVRRDDGAEVRVTGPAGTSFFSNTMWNHRGLLPTQERILFWARWGVSEPPESYKWDNLHPVPSEGIPDYPSDPRLRESLRFLVT